MNDTSEDMRIVHERALLRMSPEERLRAAAGMHDAARAMVRASLPQEADPEEVVYALLRRMYAEEIGEEMCRAAAARTAARRMPDAGR